MLHFRYRENLASSVVDICMTPGAEKEHGTVVVVATSH